MKKSMISEKVLSSLILVLGMVAAVAMAFMALKAYWQEKIKIEEKKALSEAIDGCSHTSKYIYENIQEGIRTEELIKGQYEECMRIKGY